MTIKNIYVDVSIEYDTKDVSQVVYSALKPEIGLEFTKSRCHVNINGNEILMNIKAPDISAARAALNSYLRWIACAENVYKGV